MLNIDIDKQNGIAVFEPDHKLSEYDFKNVANVIDPYIEEFNHLNGLIISAESF